MKKTFWSYHQPTQTEFRNAWGKALFVFDTNVLLNLYSYTSNTRESFIDVLKKLAAKKQVWIPHQVGLEFHLNRFKRVNTHETSLLDVQKEIEKINTACQALTNLTKKHFEGDLLLDKEIKHIQEIHTKLVDKTKDTKEKGPQTTLDDQIADGLCKLLDGVIGEECSADELKVMLVDAETRYENRTPPGFADTKEKAGNHYYNGVEYPKKYGDLILWRQLLKHTKEKEIKTVIFITGDQKNDWWWEENGKTLGPLPQLRQEMQKEAGVEFFWIYEPQNFLNRAKEHFRMDEKILPASAIEEVTKVADADRSRNLRWRMFFERDGDELRGDIGLPFQIGEQTEENFLNRNVRRYWHDEINDRGAPQKDFIRKAMKKWIRKKNPHCAVVPVLNERNSDVFLAIDDKNGKRHIFMIDYLEHEQNASTIKKIAMTIDHADEIFSRGFDSATILIHAFYLSQFLDDRTYNMLSNLAGQIRQELSTTSNLRIKEIIIGTILDAEKGFLPVYQEKFE